MSKLLVRMKNGNSYYIRGIKFTKEERKIFI